MNRRLPVILAAALLAACTTGPSGSPSPSRSERPTEAPSSTGSTGVPVDPTPSASSPASPVIASLPDPGRPFDAAAILAAMRDSRRPGGVPDQLETDAIAAALADAIWTYDGRPWTTMALGGSCGADSCTVEVAGGVPGGAGDDAWTFSVAPSTAAVEVLDTDLRAIPSDLVRRLDGAARQADPSLTGMLLASAEWLPPPDADRFALHYRSGDEEGSPARDVVLDASTGRLVDEGDASSS